MTARSASAALVKKQTGDVLIVETGPGKTIEVALEKLCATDGTRKNAKAGDWLYRYYDLSDVRSVENYDWKKIQNPTVELEG